MEIILSLGSNLGDRLANLIQAREALAHLPQTRLVCSSRVYATDPVNCADGSPEYLNAIVILETTLDVRPFFNAMQAIETQWGRTRSAERQAPRLIDIDLICWGDRTIDEPDLQLPHPRAHLRRFVCEPLTDMRPTLILPGQSEDIRAILAGLPPDPTVRLASEQWVSRHVTVPSPVIF